MTGSYDMESCCRMQVLYTVFFQRVSWYSMKRCKVFAVKSQKLLHLNNAKQSWKPWLSRTIALFSTHYISNATNSQTKITESSRLTFWILHLRFCILNHALRKTFHFLFGIWFLEAFGILTKKQSLSRKQEIAYGNYWQIIRYVL